MEKEVGLWIDQRKTVIVTIAGEGEEIRQIRSNIEEHIKVSEGLRSKHASGSQPVTGEDKRARQFMEHLSGYYDAVFSLIRDADSILLLGPGDAKVELGKRIESENFSGRVVGIETVGKMTDRQIAAKVRQRYSGWD